MSIPFASEDALHTLLQQSPELLPWSDAAPVVVARELAVPLTGYADLVFVSAVGEISVVECKLSSNSEMRRHIVGQVFAYASGIAEMSYEQLDSAFSTCTNQSLMEAMAEAVPDEGSAWDAETFRSTVAANLAAGRMGLLIAVDGITEELKRIVEFINLHTTPDLRVMALELSLVKDGDMEILLPTVFGEEGLRIKPSPSKPSKWDEASFFAALDSACSEQGAQAFRKIYQHAVVKGAGFYWGEGSMPSVSAFYMVDGENISVWSSYLYRNARATFDVNFGYIVSRGIALAKLQALLHTLSTISGVADRYADVATKEFKKRPSLSVDEYLTKPMAVETIIRALDDLITPTEPPTAIVK
jgi:hypothetical protein